MAAAYGGAVRAGQLVEPQLDVADRILSFNDNLERHKLIPGRM